MFLGKMNCVGDKNFMKNSMIKGGIGNYLNSGTFFLNIVDFHFTLCLNNIFYNITHLLPFHFTVLSVLDNTLFYV